MPGLFNASERQQIINRIESLNPGAQPQWGKMNAAQMLAHCQAPVRVALGELKLKQSLIGLLFGRIAKKKMMAPGPFSKNLPTAPSFLVKEQRDFEAERSTLINLIKRFEAGPQVLSMDTHPFFGKMTTQEWDLLQWKHLDHHLTQFGV